MLVPQLGPPKQKFLAPHLATWERFMDLQYQFPYLNLEDRIHLQGQGNVMS